MTVPIRPKIEKLKTALMTGSGHETPERRQHVEAYAAKLAGATRDKGELPENLVAYVDKVARHAYQITDEDIEALKAAGYSEDQVFEITLSAALGAGLARLERGLSALKERDLS